MAKAGQLSHGSDLKIYTICFVLIVLLVTLTNCKVNQCGNMDQTFTAAANRSLLTFTFKERKINSRILCVKYCHANLKCRSVNYDITDRLCQLNSATRDAYPDKFSTHYGSVYFDAAVDTPLFSAPRSCIGLLEAGYSSGIFTIYPAGFSHGLRVYCDMDTDGGGWIVFQRRQDGSVDFYRNWADYRHGFGNFSTEFWLGNDDLRILTESAGPWQLRVDLEDWQNQRVWAEYDGFQILGENFQLKLNSYISKSTAGDSLTIHNGKQFSTKDKDKNRCAEVFKGAWWYNNCHQSHLNGLYHQGGISPNSGLLWVSWKGYNYSVKKCSMKIRETL